MAENIVVVIKVANQSFGDQKLECNPDSNVLDLKEKISCLHPAKPLIKEQKLIYSGHLLQDDVLLKSAFRHSTENNENTVHLVCSAPKSPPIKQSSSNTSSSHGTNPTRVASLASGSTTDGVRMRISNEQPLSMSSSQQGPVGGFESSSVYSPQVTSMPTAFQGIPDPVQQMAMMQQMYAQYMTSYMQYMMQSGSMDSGRTASETTYIPATSNSPSFIQNDNLPGPEMARGNDPAVDQRDGQNRANVQVFNEEDEEGMLRDWLDYMYLGARMTVLFSIVYFYSTFSRFLIVACASILLYLYQTGWFRFASNNEDRVETPVQPQQPPPPAPHRDERQGERSAADPPPTENSTEGPATFSQDLSPENPTNLIPTQDNPANFLTPSQEAGLRNRFNQPHLPLSSPVTPVAEAPLVEPPPQPPQPSILSLSFTFLTTFFTSLLPEQQQVI